MSWRCRGFNFEFVATKQKSREKRRILRKNSIYPSNSVLLSAFFLNFNAEELAQYEANRMNMLDYNASMKFARKEGVAVGRDEGVAIGVEKGIAIGRDEGIALGKEEGLLQTTRKMKAKGLNIALIAEVTGLSEREIEGLDIDG
jgi:predicted transposase/invertase (TIGR01784 family)